MQSRPGASDLSTEFRDDVFVNRQVREPELVLPETLDASEAALETHDEHHGRGSPKPPRASERG